MNKKLVCYLDGNSLCIVKKDFINLQESESVFIELKEHQIQEINKLFKSILNLTEVK